MIASGQTIRRVKPVTPFFERTKFEGFTYGLGPAGYDIRCAQAFQLKPGDFKLASTVEHFNMPWNWLGVVHDKSTWGRLGLAVQNTVIEPGWRGHLTIELSVHGTDRIAIPEGCPIAQVVFHILDASTEMPYEGKYQDQEDRPVAAILEYGDKPYEHKAKRLVPRFTEATPTPMDPSGDGSFKGPDGAK